MKHAKLAPSASSRWMNCPGCIKLCEKVPKPPSTDFADEGTAAHALGELALSSQNPIDVFANFSGSEILIDKETEKTWPVDEEMIEHIRGYVEYVKDIKRSTALKKELIPSMYVEERFDLSWLYPGVFGSNDCCVYLPREKTLHVIDLKYGKGIRVEPEWNSQLMIYALGAVEFMWKEQVKKTKDELQVKDVVKNIVITIVQPRNLDGDEDTGIRTWDIDVEDLFFWGHNVFRPAAVATENADAMLAVGEHCRFCPAIAICPEQAKNALAVAKTDFDNAKLPHPEDLTPEELLKVLNISAVIANWTKGVKEYIHQNMEAGVEYPGWKLVKSRSNRKWTDEEHTLEVLEELVGEEAFTKKILSPKQAEELLKKNNISPEATIAGLYFKPDTGTAIAKDSDRRKAIVSSIVGDFELELGFLQ